MSSLSARPFSIGPSARSSRGTVRRSSDRSCSPTAVPTSRQASARCYPKPDRCLGSWTRPRRQVYRPSPPPALHHQELGNTVPGRLPPSASLENARAPVHPAGGRHDGAPHVTPGEGGSIILVTLIPRRVGSSGSVARPGGRSYGEGQSWYSIHTDKKVAISCQASWTFTSPSASGRLRLSPFRLLPSRGTPLCRRRSPRGPCSSA